MTLPNNIDPSQKRRLIERFGDQDWQSAFSTPNDTAVGMFDSAWGQLESALQISISRGQRSADESIKFQSVPRSESLETRPNEARFEFKAANHVFIAVTGSSGVRAIWWLGKSVDSSQLNGVTKKYEQGVIGLREKETILKRSLDALSQPVASRGLTVQWIKLNLQATELGTAVKMAEAVVNASSWGTLIDDEATELQRQSRLSGITIGDTSSRVLLDDYKPYPVPLQFMSNHALAAIALLLVIVLIVVGRDDSSGSRMSIAAFSLLVVSLICVLSYLHYSRLALSRANENKLLLAGRYLELGAIAHAHQNSEVALAAIEASALITTSTANSNEG